MQTAMPRKSKWPIKFSANAEEGLLEWIDALLDEEEDRSAFIRKALRQEARRRDPEERKKPK